MKIYFRIIQILILLGLSSILFACSSGANEPPKATLKIGVISGPEADLMRIVQQVAQKNYNLNLQVIEFSDYSIPNTALNDGSIDANMFQHQPYLSEVLKNTHYALTPIAKTFVYPMAIYSKKINDLSKVSYGALVAIPNDPSNEARALLLLQQANLIKLKPGVDVNATIFDIQTNPKKIKVIELDAAQLPRVLPDVSLGVINTNYAIPAGLNPNKDALFVENKNSPYANLIVVRSRDVKDPKFQLLVKAFQSSEIINAANKLFDGGAVPAWDASKN